MWAATLFAGYKCTGEQMLLATLLATDVYKRQDIYPIIARKYNKKIGSIKSNVIRATEAMYYNCEENTIKEYFNNRCV